MEKYLASRHSPLHTREKSEDMATGKESIHSLNNIPGELAIAERRSAWRRQFAGNPILTTWLPELDFASSMSLAVISPSETQISPWC